MSRVQGSLPTWAEKFFALECVTGGAICTRPDEDRNGWDFLVELPEQPHLGPAEMRPPPRIVFAQIKSTTTRSLSVAVKLSNMHMSARSRDPWFIFLIARNPETGSTRVFGRHVWHDLISRTLQRVRLAEAESSAAHKATLSVRFGRDDEITGSVVDWMSSAVAGQQNYESTKWSIYESVGYDAGGGTGRLTVTAATEEEIVRGLLGLGAGLTVESFAYTHARFGIPDPTPSIMKDGKVIIEPQPVGEIELRIRGPVGHPSLKLPGKVYALAGPAFQGDKARLRISAPPVEMVWRPDGPTRVEAILLRDKKYPIRTFRTYVTIAMWTNIDVAEAELWAGGQLAMSGKFGPMSGPVDIERLRLILDALEAVTSKQDVGEIEFSLSDIDNALPSLAYFGQLVAPRTMKVEWHPDGGAAHEADGVAYHVSTTLSEWQISCVIKRNILARSNSHDLSVVYCSPPTIVETFVSRPSSQFPPQLIHTEYSRIVGQLPDRSLISLGDIAAFLSDGGPR